MIFDAVSRQIVMALIMLVPAIAVAEEANIAVATNFAEVAQQLESTFEQASDHELTITTGSTGKLYAQILQGAPFDVLLAADQERPKLLEASHNGMRGTRFTYATGVLVLWSPDARRIIAGGGAALSASQFRTLAMANPDLAPYGAAARQTLLALGLWEALEQKIVLGENVGQAFAYVATRNAELGFVALAQIVSPRNEQMGSQWKVPHDLHAPIHQDALLLAHGEDNHAAMEFLAYLSSEPARTVIASSGYEVD